MDNNCTLCKYAQRNQVVDKDGKPVVGQYQHHCLRFPPSAFAVPNAQGMVLASAFPVVTVEQVCSLYEDRDNESNALPPPPLRLT